MIHYPPLSTHRPDAPVRLLRAPELELPPVMLEDPAAAVVTDLRRTATLTVPLHTSVDAVLERMIHAGVRLLFVVDEPHGALCGLVSSWDLQGEAPLRVLQERAAAGDHATRADLWVADVMRPLHDWPVIERAQLASAKVGHLAATFRSTGTRHLIVIEADRDDGWVVCGLCSASRLARQLGVSLDQVPVETGFAAIVEAVMHPT